jgi:hypothetical protein
MILFSSKLSEVENRLLSNAKKTKGAFSEETQLLESGLALMHDMAYGTQDTVRDFKKTPNLLTNHNLFARNRELLLNAYFCMLCSSYGTLVVILRVVLENAFLMRLFKEKPQFAFEWLSKEIQEQFSSRIKSKYGKSGISDKKGNVDLSRAIFSDVAKKKARMDVNRFYKQLSDYSHPNFAGWTHLITVGEGYGIIQSIPQFSANYTDEAIGMMLYFMQLSFKAFYETFKDSLLSFTPQLVQWQENFKKLMARYEGRKILS